MTITEFQTNCLRTWRASGTVFDQLENCAHGLAEIGEVQNLIKKSKFHGHELDQIAIIDELGDVAFYVAVTAQIVAFDSFRFENLKYPITAEDVSLGAIKTAIAVGRSQLAIDLAIETQRVFDKDYRLDAVWSGLAFIAAELESSMEEVMKHNVEKLIKRYPDGFDEKRSIYR